MDSDRCKDSGEMYSANDQGEYMSLDGTPQFSIQRLSDALVDVRKGLDETPAEEYAMMLEVTIAIHPGQPRSPTFSWNAGMVMHILKSEPVLRVLEHIQVDGDCLFVLLQETGPLVFGPGYCVCDLGLHGGGFLRVDFVLCPLYH